MQINNIELKDVAGYLTEKSIWQIIKDMAASNSESIWDIGATAFYALMGVEVIAGKDSGPVPRISTSHCSQQLSDLIYRCLASDASQRPSPKELISAADHALDVKTEPSKRLATATGKSYKTSIVKFWPEEMCSIIIILLMLILPLGTSAQNKPQLTQEMETLVKRCCDLRNAKNTTRIERAFYDDRQWTLMDELAIDSNGECTIHNKVSTLGLNEMGYRIAKYNRGISNTGGRFRNGQDPRYNYSFIEVTAKKGATLKYNITGREGKQVFAVIPYKQGSAFGISLTRKGLSIGKSYDADGVKYIAVDENIKTSDILTLRIVNTSGGNLSFVIINYNSRQSTK